MQVRAAPRVLAVIVTHDGAAWLPRALDALSAQTYPEVDVIAVDNLSADSSRELLVERLGHERVLVTDRDLGFGAAVAMALDGYHGDATYLWLLHDDLAPDPDCLRRLVDAQEDDPRLAIVGPKLRSWTHPDQLQSVGWTIDLTGRADSGVDPGELDQGQRDQDDRALYVSTAGMLLRRSAFDELGRFDRRYHLFRDDLDLCWRAWLAGYEVEIVADAVAEHLNAAAEYVRLGQTRFIGPRYFAERNTLATLLKNYSAARLPLVVALYLVVGVAKVVGFLLTRRVSDAWQTLRAWLWNLWHLPETWRLRRTVQRLRRREDGELRDLFARITPRVRAYVEAIADWIAGGDQASVPTARPQEVPDDAMGDPALRRVARRLRARPILVASSLLVLLMGIASWPLFVAGELRGGDLAPWPTSPVAFLGDYTAGWSEAGAFGTTVDPSPAQALLGLLQVVVGGSGFLAPRVLLLGSFLVAWILALRAAQTYSRRRVPRVVAATAYVLSPPALAAVATGEVGALVVFALLPGIVAAGITLSRRRSTPERAWRAVSAVALLTAVAGAFEPLLLVVILVTGTLIILVSLTLGRPTVWHRALAIRVVVASAAPWVLLLPWSLGVLDPDGPLRGASGQVVDSELWRWLLLSPDLAGFPGILAGVGFLLAGLLGLVLASQRAPGFVAALWSAALGGAAIAWWLGQTGRFTWSGLPLLVTAAAFAGLFALAFATGGQALARFGFGWRQIAAGTTALGVAVSVGVVAFDLVRGPWDAFAVGDPPLPAFVQVAAEESPFRVLVLADTDEGVVWEVVDGTGPTMASFGVPEPPALDHVEDLLGAAVERRDPEALSRLGPLNIRFVLVPSGATSAALDDALRAQTRLEPRPFADGRLFQVDGWMPPAALISPAEAEVLLARGSLPEGAQPTALERDEERVYRARLTDDAVAFVADADDGEWSARADGRRLQRQQELPLLFETAEAPARLTIEHEGGPARRLAVAGQILVALLTFSLALRPPSFARRREEPADGVEDAATEVRA